MSRILDASFLIFVLASGLFGITAASDVSSEDGFVSDEYPIESSAVSAALSLEDHFEDHGQEHGIQTCCTLGQTGVDNAHYLYVSTMDGKVSALDVTNGGKLSWDSHSFDDGSPLLKGTLSSTQMSMNDIPYSLVPSLDGSLYMYSYDDGALQPIPLDTNMLLRTTMIGNDAVAGGRIVTVTGVDPITGTLRYRCGPDNCDQSKDASSESATLVMQRVVNTVRGVDSIHGHEKWNLSVGEYVLLLSRRNDGIYTQPGDSHLKFRVSLADGVVSAYDSCGSRVWSHDFAIPVAKVYEMFQGHLKEISLFSNENVENYDQLDPFGDNPNIDSHAYIGTVNYRPYIIPSPEARKELRNLALKEEVCSFQPSANSHHSHGAMIIEDKSITSIITGAYENMSRSYSDSCPSKESYTVTTSESEEMIPVPSEHKGNQGWFILRYRPPQHKELEDLSSNVARRSTYVPTTREEKRPSKREQIRHTIKNAFNTEESVSGLWRLAALVMSTALLFLTGFVMCICRRPSKAQTSPIPTATPTTNGKSEQTSSTEKEKPGQRKTLRESTSSGSYTFPTTPTDPSLFVSKFLQDFDPVKCLGRGGFGVVFECLNKLDECYYAIKRIAVSDSVSATERVRREVRAMAKLDHPGIIRYYHTWIEHPPRGWQAETDRRILSEMSVGSSMLETSASEESHSKAQATGTKHKDDEGCNDSSASNASTLSVENTWDVSFANVTNNESPVAETSSDSEDCALPKSALVDLTESSDGIIFGSESSEPKDRSSSHEEEGPLVPPVVLVATETSELQTSRSRTNYVYMYIQMELCQRETLHEWLLSNRRRDAVQMRRWFRELVDAIAYIHSQGLIHRDLKPQNIFFAATGRLKVGDLGLATQNLECMETSDIESLSMSAGCSHTGNVGTKSYMSPEQLSGKSYNSKVDVFSLGLIFCEMIKSFATVMERIDVLQGLQKGKVSDVLLSLSNDDLTFIKWLTDVDSEERPSCSEILSSEYLQDK
ncbi:hypothetical protein QR680_002044 [Steinernema hermaphroditum]|uniref:PRKR-like endoplasmic reticulum kinase n=1 Tax=Steinernema hermaphroditum TaxID=289476 RepID=A0AA39H2Q5_9BILA|nr:hypothetical protein QR680_002044 [Steinernema hermaphroditum]